MRFPEEYGAMFTRSPRIPGGMRRGITLSAHCHDDLGMAVANSLAAIRAGCAADRVHDQRNRRKRAGKCLPGRSSGGAGGAQGQLRGYDGHSAGRTFPYEPHAHRNHGERRWRRTKRLWGANAFAHEAGIHQDGIIKNPLTYEIMTPQSVGVPARSLVLGKHSGRNGLRLTLRDLGYEAERHRAGGKCIAG